ncbi:hypothetical protein [Draconibacterium sediminis]|uniref:Outer membrane protein beta-barrel domain-containing protein n=1 Tax=Draconibacterium sediminis TaxID=1544798 RepID=A0A0D8J960_9BACT|nr:hypothetical protein [Draconibacterium sediminis]KJF43259.1 hypothetical protein LH29_13465 [Draconibacterium sediminis]
MNIIKLKRYKQILIATLLLFSMVKSGAQDSQIPQGELSFYLKEVNSMLHVELFDNGSGETCFGAGVQYNYYVTRGLSFSGGLEYQPYRSKIILDDFTDSYSLIDSEGDDMIFRSSANLYRERHTVRMLNIPLLVQWETKGLSTSFFTATGIQLGIPLAANYKATVDGLETAGYFPQWDALLTSPRFMGFGEWDTQQSGKEKLKLKSSYSFLFELGIKQRLKNEFRHLYVSVYLELGLNDLKNEKNQQTLISYNVENPTDFHFSSVIYSYSQASGYNYVNKIKSQSVGFRIRYSFGW